MKFTLITLAAALLSAAYANPFAAEDAIDAADLNAKCVGGGDRAAGSNCAVAQNGPRACGANDNRAIVSPTRQYSCKSAMLYDSGCCNVSANSLLQLACSAGGTWRLARRCAAGKTCGCNGQGRIACR